MEVPEQFRVLEADSLMIGNYVTVDGATCRVLSIPARGLSMELEVVSTKELISKDISEIKAMHLTPDDLKFNLGFVKVGEKPIKDTTKKGMVAYRRGGVVLFMYYNGDEDEVEYTFVWNDLMEEVGNETILQYIHEVQNLCLVLNGRSLIIRS